MTNHLYTAIQAAINAGKAIMDIYTDPKADFGVEYKADNSPLTKADKAAHILIEKALTKTPYPILSEEGKDIPYSKRAKWNSLWVVDPLDGTKEFIKRNGEFTVNIALVEKKIPVLGVIYVPVRKELYFATKTLGAFKVTDIDHTNLPSSLEDLQKEAKHLPASIGHQGIVVVASRSHKTEETNLFIENIRKQGQPVTTIDSGSSIKICLVAEGSADVYPRFAPTMEWDTAAGHAIAKAAGCEIYQFNKNIPLDYNKKDLTNGWFIVKPISAEY